MGSGVADGVGVGGSVGSGVPVWIGVAGTEGGCCFCCDRPDRNSIRPKSSKSATQERERSRMRCRRDRFMFASKGFFPILLPFCVRYPPNGIFLLLVRRKGIFLSGWLA